MKQGLRTFFFQLCGKRTGVSTPSMHRRTFLRSVTGLCAVAAIVGAQEEEKPKSMIVRSRCVGCGDCVRQCPVTAISLENGKAWVNRAICVGCRMCAKTCSYGAPRI